MKYLLFLLIAAAQAQPAAGLDAGTERLIDLLQRQCGVARDRVAETVHKLHALYAIKRVEFVESSTNASYYILGGTLRMSLSHADKICEKWVAELSHAAQFSQNLLKYSLLTARDVLRTFLRLPTLTKAERQSIRRLVQGGCPRLKATGWILWQRTNGERGTVEYNAHHEREPRIMEFVQLNFYGSAEHHERERGPFGPPSFYPP